MYLRRRRRRRSKVSVVSSYVLDPVVASHNGLQHTTGSEAKESLTRSGQGVCIYTLVRIYIYHGVYMDFIGKNQFLRSNRMLALCFP